MKSHEAESIASSHCLYDNDKQARSSRESVSPALSMISTASSVAGRPASTKKKKQQRIDHFFAPKKKDGFGVGAKQTTSTTGENTGPEGATADRCTASGEALPFATHIPRRLPSITSSEDSDHSSAYFRPSPATDGAHSSASSRTERTVVPGIIEAGGNQSVPGSDPAEAHWSSEYSWSLRPQPPTVPTVNPNILLPPERQRKQHDSISRNILAGHSQGHSNIAPISNKVDLRVRNSAQDREELSHQMQNRHLRHQEHEREEIEQCQNPMQSSGAHIRTWHDEQIHEGQNKYYVQEHLPNSSGTEAEYLPHTSTALSAFDLVSGKDVVSSMKWSPAWKSPVSKLRQSQNADDRIGSTGTNKALTRMAFDPTDPSMPCQNSSKDHIRQKEKLHGHCSAQRKQASVLETPLEPVDTWSTIPIGTRRAEDEIPASRSSFTHREGEREGQELMGVVEGSEQGEFSFMKPLFSSPTFDVQNGPRVDNSVVAMNSLNLQKSFSDAEMPQMEHSYRKTRADKVSIHANRKPLIESGQRSTPSETNRLGIQPERRVSERSSVSLNRCGAFHPVRSLNTPMARHYFQEYSDGSSMESRHVHQQQDQNDHHADMYQQQGSGEPSDSRSSSPWHQVGPEALGPENGSFCGGIVLSNEPSPEEWVRLTAALREGLKIGKREEEHHEQHIDQREQPHQHQAAHEKQQEQEQDERKEQKKEQKKEQQQEQRQQQEQHEQHELHEKQKEFKEKTLCSSASADEFMPVRSNTPTGDSLYSTSSTNDADREVRDANRNEYRRRKRSQLLREHQILQGHPNNDTRVLVIDADKFKNSFDEFDTHTNISATSSFLSNGSSGFSSTYSGSSGSTAAYIALLLRASSRNCSPNGGGFRLRDGANVTAERFLKGVSRTRSRSNSVGSRSRSRRRNRRPSNSGASMSGSTGGSRASSPVTILGVADGSGSVPPAFVVSVPSVSGILTRDEHRCDEDDSGVHDEEQEIVGNINVGGRSKRVSARTRNASPPELASQDKSKQSRGRTVARSPSPSLIHNKPPLSPRPPPSPSTRTKSPLNVFRVVSGIRDNSSQPGNAPNGGGTNCSRHSDPLRERRSESDSPTPSTAAPVIQDSPLSPPKLIIDQVQYLRLLQSKQSKTADDGAATNAVVHPSVVRRQNHAIHLEDDSSCKEDDRSFFPNHVIRLAEDYSRDEDDRPFFQPTAGGYEYTPNSKSGFMQHVSSGNASTTHSALLETPHGDRQQYERIGGQSTVFSTRTATSDPPRVTVVSPDHDPNFDGSSMGEAAETNVRYKRLVTGVPFVHGHMESAVVTPHHKVPSLSNFHHLREQPFRLQGGRLKRSGFNV